MLSRLRERSLDSNLIPLDNIFVGVKLKQLQILPVNLTSFVHGKAYQMYQDEPNILCKYVIVHLHGNTEEETLQLWKTMQINCKEDAVLRI